MAKTSSPAASERDWQAESDCDALMRAEQIKKDPKRMNGVAKIAKQRLEQNAALVAQTTNSSTKKE